MNYDSFLLRAADRVAPVARVVTLTAFASAFSVFAGEPKYDAYVPFTPENAIIGHFTSAKKPVIRVKSGDTVKIDGGGGTRWGTEDPDTWLKNNGIDGTVATLPALAESIRVLKETPRPPNLPAGHLLVGPIYVEGAEAGDSLEIQIIAVKPRIPYSANSGMRGTGGVPDLLPRPYVKIIKFDLERNVAVFDSKTEIPLAPFNGIMATCPSDDEGPIRSSKAPGLFGGNLDCKELVAGSSLFLPVFQPGALFYTGDCHGGQGDGEVSGNTMETANTAYFRFILHKGKTITAPRAESATHYLCFGLDPDLNKAMQMAIKETIAFLGEKRGYDLFDAYSLSSVAVDFRVTQFVDWTVGIHSMIPKSLFKGPPPEFWAAQAQPGQQRSFRRE